MLGLAIMTIGVYGLFRMPDVYTRSHAASKASFLGVVALLGAAALQGDGAIAARAVLIAALLALTTPVAAHARAAARRGGVVTRCAHRGRSTRVERRLRRHGSTRPWRIA